MKSRRKHNRFVSISILVSIAVMNCVAPIHAHPVGDKSDDPSSAHASDPSRLWHDTESGETIRGKFLAFRDDVIRIERDNGEIASLHLHALPPEDREFAQAQIEQVRTLNQDSRAVLSRAGPASRPASVLPFDAFAPNVRTRWDETHLYVESDGMPSHPMMVGIRSWQQQVPLPQPYAGKNAWRIPLLPKPASQPVSAKESLFRGAIALAANGVPIFNPIKNDGRTDTYLAGELDEYGGHSGRADDYHYHIAPLHLQEKLGRELPVAIALDGYPIYGLLDDKACPFASAAALDSFNGHTDANGEHYHYHASKTYPYINGGMHGEVTVKDGQIDPQPRAEPIRPSLTPLRGAKITGFNTIGEQSWRLEYTIDANHYTQSYRVDSDGTAIFETTGPDGKTNTQTFAHRPGRNPPSRRETNQSAPGNEPRPDRDEGNTPRKPWFVVHALEMDADHDGVLTTEEVAAEIETTFGGYDTDQDGKITATETRDPVRSALGGFVKEHFKELADGKPATEEDIRRAVMRMFNKQDRNHDGKLSGDELKERPR